MELGKAIAQLRKEHNITQKDLAKELNVTRNIVCMWENDQRIPTYENFLGILDYFEISADVLIQKDRKCKPTIYTHPFIEMDEKLIKLIDTYMLLSEDGKDALIGKAKELKIMQESTNSYPFTQAN
jgi:transcriptional regulator with XRE-family HTH domain